MGCSAGSAVAIGERSGSPASASRTSLIEIATITARDLAGQPVKCGGECAGLAEIRCTRQRARFMPSAEVMPGRNEDHLAREIAQGRPGQAFNKGLTVVALPKLWNKEQMAGSPKTIFEWRVLRDLNRFHVEARPGRGIASEDLRR